MSENKTNVTQGAEAKKDNTTIDADVIKDENGQEKAVPKKTAGEVVGGIWNGVKNFGAKAMPWVLGAAGGAAAMFVGLAVAGGKDESEDDVVDTTAKIEDKDNSESETETNS